MLPTHENRHVARGLLAAAVLAPAALAQVSPPTPLILRSDPVPGIGNVTAFENVVMNEAGSWLIEVDTDNPSLSDDGVVLREGVPTLIEGIPWPFPPGAMIDEFDSISLNRANHSVWNFTLSGAVTTATDTALYYDILLLIQEGDVSNAPAVAPGTVYRGFFEAKYNDANTVLLVATINDPTVATTTEQAILRLQLDASGAIVSETVVARRDDVLPGQSEIVVAVGSNAQQSALNAVGDVMYFVDLAGPITNDGCFYVNQTLVAQEGQPSPVPGRNYDLLQGRACDLNDLGDYVFRAQLDGSLTDNELVVVNGAKFVQTGDMLPAISPYALTSFSASPVYISNSGDILWRGEWSDPGTATDAGLFLNHELLIHEGVTQIGGVTVAEVYPTPETMKMTKSGSDILFEMRLVDGTRGIYRISRSVVTPLPTCSPNAGTLELASGSPSIGTTFRLEMGNAQAIGANPFLVVSNRTIAGFPPCGLPTAVGEVLVDVVPPNPIMLLLGPPYVGLPVPIDIAVPNDPGLIGRVFYNQGLFADVGGPERFRLTNAVQINVGL